MHPIEIAEILTSEKFDKLRHSKTPLVGRYCISPGVAREMLEYNTRNRKIKPVSRLIREMIDKDQWVFTTQTIGFSSNGEVQDGQNRLLGCAESTGDIDTLVVWGADPDAIWATDRGRPRNNSDHLCISKEDNPGDLASALAFVYRLENGLLGESNVSPNALEIEDVLARHGDIRDSVLFCKVKSKDYCSRSTAAFFHYVFTRIDPIKGEAFFDGLLTGANLDQTSPVKLLRDRLLRRHQPQGHVSTIQVLAFFVKAWNAFRDDKVIGQLRYVHRKIKNADTGNYTPKEVFPDIGGYKAAFGTAEPEIAPSTDRFQHLKALMRANWVAC